MILNLLLLLGVVLSKVWGHVGAPDAADDFELNSDSAVLRFANVEFLSNDDSLIQMTLYRHRDDEGVKFSQDNTEFILSALNPHEKIYILFNGHPSSDSKQAYEELRKGIFQRELAKILMVFIDWTKHRISYLDGMILSESFGSHIGTMLSSLSELASNFHFMGHCIGAEVATAAAKTLTQLTKQKVPRFTVFDPYITNKTIINHAKSYAQYIDVYHAGIYNPPYPPVGHIDFYPNGGAEQPGCNGTTLDKFICHHRRSIHLYTESIFTEVDALEARYNHEGSYLEILDEPLKAPFGYMVDQSSVGLAFHLPTYDTAPYLMDYY